MTIGDGVFLSTIVLVAFASTVLLTKYKRWISFFKVLTFSVAVGSVIGIGVWIYTKYENRPQVMSSLNGISLGMSEVDVTLKMGEADKTSKLDSTSDGFRKYLLFEGSNSIRNTYVYTILRGQKDSMVVTDICDKGGYGKVLGFGELSKENDILEKLGQPANVSINELGTEKILSYPRWNSAFELAQGLVTKVCVSNQPQVRYSVEYGVSTKAKGLK